MSNLRNEIRDILICNRKIESFNDLSDEQKHSLAVTALGDFDTLDPADILLYRNRTLQAIARKFTNRKMTGDQFATRFIQLMSDGSRLAIDEIIDEERPDLMSDREFARAA